MGYVIITVSIKLRDEEGITSEPNFVKILVWLER
jgi:hypothetical protein